MLTPRDTLLHCLDQLAHNLPPRERDRYIRQAEKAAKKLDEALRDEREVSHALALVVAEQLRGQL